MNEHGRMLMISTHGYVAAAPELGKADTGGQVVYVLELSKTLARMGFAVDILTRRFESQPAEEHVAPGVRIIRLPCGGHEFIEKERLVDQLPELVERFARFVERRELAYQWINSHYWDAGTVGMALGQRWAVPHLHTPHSLGAWKRDQTEGAPDELERLYNFSTRIATEREICQRCARVIATTIEQKTLLSAGEYAVPPRHIHVVPPGYDDLRFFPVSTHTRSALRARLGWSGRVILALGRVALNKGYDLLISSLPTVLARCPDAHLVLAIGSTAPSAGELAYIDQLRQLASDLGVEDRVRFDDYIPDDMLADTYRAADVFALSSRYEPFGMTAVEAMACGVPTVLTTAGALWRECEWGRDALAVDPRDTEALGHTLVQILSNARLARRLSRHGALRARGRYTWTAVASRIARIADSFADRFQRLTADGHEFDYVSR